MKEVKKIMKLSFFVSLMFLVSCSSNKNAYFKYKDMGYSCSRDKKSFEDEDSKVTCIPINLYRNESIMYEMQPWEERMLPPMPDTE